MAPILWLPSGLQGNCFRPQILIQLSYAAIGNQLNTKSPVTYWVGNPNSYVWLDSNRPLSTTSCPEYDFYRDGYTNFTEYPSESLNYNDQVCPLTIVI